MRKLSLVVLTAALVVTSAVPANAVSKTAELTKAFQKYLTQGEVNYAKSIADARALYEPQIASAQTKLLTAQVQFTQSNQVTILKTTTHSPSGAIGIDAVNCPETRSDCKDPVYKSNEFKAGEIATIYNLIGGDAAFSASSYAQMNLGILQTVDLEVKDGLISLNNSIGYNAAVSTMRSQSQTIQSLSQQFTSAKIQAEINLQEIHEMASTINSAIVSAKRAALNVSMFDKAFVTSFKFEYNAKRLDELARAPWTYISSLKALRDAVSVTNQSELADSISNRYSYTSANKLNSTYGNLFLVEQSYRNGFQIISSIYKSVTGATLSRK